MLTEMAAKIKLNYIPEHYGEILTHNRLGEHLDSVKDITKQNLNIIGGIFTNE